MKIRLLILSVLLFAMFANSRVNAQLKISQMPGVIAKPFFEGSDKGINMKVWIMGIARDLGNVEVNGKTINYDDVNDTHDVMVRIEDQNGKSISDEEVKLLLVSPSGKKEAVDLDPKSDQYGSAVALTEVGEYHLTVSINADGKPATQTTFHYKVYR